MIFSLRIHRTLAAFMVVTLLCGGILPLVQHACAMMRQHDQEHCTPEHTGHATPVDHQGHGGMDNAMPCHDQIQPTAADDTSHTMDDCCFLSTAQALPVAPALHQTPQSRLLDTMPVVLFIALPKLDAGLSAPLPFSDTGPLPGPTVSLHLIHSVLLN